MSRDCAEKAMADVELLKRNNSSSSSIVAGTWVGVGAVRNIISDLTAEYEYELEKLKERNGLLETIVEETITRPKGVEPHSWSDYKHQKSL